MIYIETIPFFLIILVAATVGFGLGLMWAEYEKRSAERQRQEEAAAFFGQRHDGPYDHERSGL